MNNRAFTLVELLVSMALFVTLIGVTAISFQRVSAGGEKSLQVLELHSKADSLLRYIELDVRNMQQTLAMHLQTDAEPYTLTFMKPVNDAHGRYFHKGSTIRTSNVFKPMPPRLTDIIWVRWSWEDGGFSRGQSRGNVLAYGDGENYRTATYAQNTGKFLKTLDVNAAIPLGIQNNGITPTPQRHYEFFEGKGASLNTIDSDGDSAAAPGEKLTVSETVNGTWTTAGPSWSKKPDFSDYFDVPSAPWKRGSSDYPEGDYRHLYTTLECGNQNAVTDAYAVRNADGWSVNKDRLNLLGCDAVDSEGNKIYPTQVFYLFDGVEYMEMTLIKRNGQVLTAAHESDRLGDGAASLDVSGIDPVSGAGFDQRPAYLRLSYLLHSIDLKERDVEDYDGDGIDDEPLSSAIRSVVEAEGGTRLEKIHSYKKHALHYGFSSLLISQSIRLGL